MNDDIVARADRALEGVTEGPWTITEGTLSPGSEIVGANRETVIFEQDEQGGPAWGEDVDARFIAESRTLVPELQDEVVRLQDELKRKEYDHDETRKARDRARKSRNTLYDQLVEAETWTNWLIAERVWLTNQSALRSLRDLQEACEVLTGNLNAKIARLRDEVQYRNEALADTRRGVADPA